MIVLSLFDGMSGGQIALVDMGATPDTYYASEVDKHAIRQTQLNFPHTIQLGDVRDIDVSKLQPIDLLIGGSPCQSFSFAGKRNGMTTKCQVEITTLEHYLELKSEGFAFEGQSYLFWEYMRILTDIRRYNPDVLFLLENVEMGKKWERVLSEAIGIYGVHINSALVSAQNRKRIYWTNIRVKEVGLFKELHSDIPQPADRGILLKDILEKEVDEKYYLSEKMLSYFSNRAANFNNGKVNVRDESAKATTLTSSMASCDISDNFILDTKLTPKQNQDKSNCFTAGGNSGGLHSDMDLVCVAMRGRNPDDPSDRSSTTQQRLEPNTTGKTNCLTSVQKDNLVVCLTPKRTEYGKAIRKDYEAGKVEAQRKEVSQLEPRPDGKTNTLTTVQKDNLVMQIKSLNNRVEGVSFNDEGIRPHQGDYRKSGIQELGTIALENTKTSCLTTNHEPKCIVQKDNLVMQLNPSTESGGKQPYQQNRIYDSEGISPALCANKADLIVRLNDRQQKNFVAHDEKTNSLLSTSYMGSQANGMSITNSGYRIRRLTPTECARLQTIPEWYRWECSDTQAYRMLGNGWTNEVIKHIFSYLPKQLTSNEQQGQSQQVCACTL